LLRFPTERGTILRRKENRQPLPRRPGWRDVSDEFWDAVKSCIPKPRRRKTRQGRPAAEPRKILNGILYVLRTGCQWKMLPREYYAGTTTHRYFQYWAEQGVFRKMWVHCLREYDDLKGIAWRWQILDSQTVSAPVKGEKNREKPYGSGKAGHQAT
jgi:putative transposase